LAGRDLKDQRHGTLRGGGNESFYLISTGAKLDVVLGLRFYPSPPFWPFSNFVEGTEGTRPAGTHREQEQA